MGFGAFYNNGNLPLPPGAQMTQAAQQFPQQLEQAQDAAFKQKEQKVQLKAQEAEMEQASQKQSLSKLGLYYKMIQSDPSGVRTRDPNFIKAVNDAAKDAGLPPMSHVDPGTGMEVLDPNALKMLAGGGKTYDQLNPEEMKMVGNALPGAARSAMYQRLGVDPATVPPEVLTAPPDSTFKGREEVIKDFTTKLADMPKGLTTVEGINSIFTTMKGELAASGVSISDVKDIIQSPQFAEQVLAPQLKAKAEQMQKMGLKDEAIQKWYEERTREMPKELASKVRIADGKLSLDEKKYDYQKDVAYKKLDQKAQSLTNDSMKLMTYMKQVDNQITTASQGRNIAQAGLVAKIADQQLKPLEKERDDLLRLEGQWFAAHATDATPFPQEDQDRLASLNQQIEDSRGKITTLQTAVESGKSNALSNMAGKQVNIKAKPLDLKNPPPGLQYSKSTGQYRDAQGNLYDKDGKPQ